MDIVAPVTDYIQDSILTTKGDLAKRGAAVVERLGIGAAGQILRVNATPDDLEYQHPGKFLFDNELSNENAGLVTVTTSWTVICTLDLGTVVSGDRFFVTARHDGQKSTTGCIIMCIEKDSGTATVVTYKDNWIIATTEYVANGYPSGSALVGVVQISGSGTLVLKFHGSCSHGSVPVAAGQGQFYAFQLKNA